LFTKRAAIPELFDRATIECILQEWHKTIYSLPSGIRMAVEMVRTVAFFHARKFVRGPLKLFQFSPA
jgi:hypothetical protein